MPKRNEHNREAVKIYDRNDAQKRAKIEKALKEITPISYRRWNEVTRLKILSFIKKGASIKSAIIMSGVDYSTYNNWQHIAAKEVEVYEEALKRGEEIPLGEYAYFMTRCQMTQITFAMEFKFKIHALYLEDARFGPMLLRLMEAEFPDYYSHKIQTQVDQKTETKITYVIEQKTGDAWANRRLEDGQLSKEQNDDVEAILEATYADTE